MSELDVIAEMQVIFCDPSGVERGGSIYIGRPYKSGRTVWSCSVSFPSPQSAHDRDMDVSGINSFHAICTAIDLIKTRLSAFLDQGGTVMAIDSKTDDRYECKFDSYFGSRQ